MIIESGQHQQIEIWHVRFASGEVKPLTLDELDQAYNAGWIDESTPLLKSGSLAWSTLGAVAGLGPPDPMPLSIAPVSWDPSPSPVSPDLSTEIHPGDLEGMPDELKPSRAGRKIFGVLVALALVAGLGVAATRARPGLTASVSGFVKSHLPGKKAEPPKAVAAAPAKVDAPAPLPQVAPPPVPAAPVVAAPASASVPSLAADQLPAADGKKSKKGKTTKGQR
jgi:hypothetical protein